MNVPRWRAALVLATLVAGCGSDQIVVYRARDEAASGAGGARDAGALPASDSGGVPSPGAAGIGGGGAPGAGGDDAMHDASPTPNGAGGMLPNGAGGMPGAAGAGSGGRNLGGMGFGGLAFGGMGSGGFPGLPVSCSVATDCPTGWTCTKIDCAEATGICQPRPFLCDSAPIPVCGCDGVTYWNDCVRQQNGVVAAMLGQCAVGAHPCNVAGDCPVAGASCARLNPIASASCGATGPGTCWVTPADCTAAPTGPSWTPCAGQGGQGPGQPARGCVNMCAAIRSEQQHVTAAPGPQCR
jgi:hypothetical protein